MTLHEDAVRFVRQRLLALEEGRDDDAATIQKYLASEFGLSFPDDLLDASVSDVARDFPSVLETWRTVYGVPESTDQVTLLMGYAGEPIFRVPVSAEDRGPSWMETPLHLIPRSLREALAPQDPKSLPPAHRPRSADAGDLPKKVVAAIRPWTPAPPPEES